MMLVVLALMLFLFWFMGRKQRKQQKIMAERRNNLKVGDKVMMTCGIYGTVTEIGDSVVTVLTGGPEGTSLVLTSSISLLLNMMTIPKISAKRKLKTPINNPAAGFVSRVN